MPRARKPTLPHRDAKWFYDKIARKQSNAVLRQLESQDLPEGVDPQQVLDACLKDYDLPQLEPRVTTVDEKILLRYLGTGKLPDEGIRNVLVHASAYSVMALHKRRPDLLPAQEVLPFIRDEALVLIDLHFVQKRQNDKRLSAFIRKLDGIPGLAEIVAVHHVHNL